MFFKKLETKGLAHYSYLVGSGNEAILIDPMRDSRKYTEILKEEGLQLKYIFETHRNEDYISGSKELGEITKATIYTSGEDYLEYEYGEKVYNGNDFTFGECIITALHTPGHTEGHMCYVLNEKGREEPFMVFTGDLLFMGDCGRTDFYGEDRLEEMTGKMYDSLFNKLLPLGDHVIVHPGHGNGSACGDAMEERPFTTLGYERIYNPKLQLSRDEFIKKHGKMRIKPRYFEKMEICNLEGAPFVSSIDTLKPVSFDEIPESMALVDLRFPQSFLEAHIPGSYFLSLGNLASFLGTILDTEIPLVFIAEGDRLDDLKFAYWTAKRIGFDHIVGFLKGGVQAYINSGKEYESIPSISAKDYLELDNPYTINILNVEDLSEIGEIEDGKMKLPLKVIYKNLDLLDKEKTIYIQCNSGNTATTAASYLIQRGYDPVVIAGGRIALEKLT